MRSGTFRDKSSLPVLVLALVLSALQLTGAAAKAGTAKATQEARHLVGRWAGIDNGRKVILLFNKDGTMTWNGRPCTYSVSAERLVVNKESGVVAYRLLLSGDKFILCHGDLTPIRSGNVIFWPEFCRKGVGNEYLDTGGVGSDSWWSKILIGRWVAEVDGQRLQFEFNPDGTMIFQEQPYRYQVEAGCLKVNSETAVASYFLQIRRQHVFLSGADITGTWEIFPLLESETASQTTSGQPVAEQINVRDIAGTWLITLGGQQKEMVFHTDGTLLWEGNRWSYIVRPGKLTVRTAASSVDYNLLLSKNKMQLSGGDITGTWELTRKAGDSGPQFSSLFDTFDPSTPESHASTPNPLIGTWVLNLGGRQEEIVFRPDGMLTWKGNTWAYTAGAAILAVNTGRQTVNYNYKVEENKLFLSGGDIQGMWMFSRGGEAGQFAGLQGTWATVINGVDSVMVINADGTLNINGQVMSYSVAGNQINISYGNQTSTYNLHLAGNQLTLSDNAGSLTFTRRVQGQETLIGNWVTSVGGMQANLTINDNGYMNFNGTNMAYSTSGNQLSVNTGYQTITYSYQLTGTTLVLSGGDLAAPVQFTRKAQPEW